jgi:hypothetical protein
MKASDIMIKKELERLNSKIKSQDENKDKIESINKVLKDKVTLLNYSEKIKQIRTILIGE